MAVIFLKKGKGRQSSAKLNSLVVPSFEKGDGDGWFVEFGTETNLIRKRQTEKKTRHILYGKDKWETEKSTKHSETANRKHR